MEQPYEAVRDINIGNLTYNIQSVGGELNMFVITKPDHGSQGRTGGGGNMSDMFIMHDGSNHRILLGYKIVTSTKKIQLISIRSRRILISAHHNHRKMGETYNNQDCCKLLFSPQALHRVCQCCSNRLKADGDNCNYQRKQCAQYKNAHADVDSVIIIH